MLWVNARSEMAGTKWTDCTFSRTVRPPPPFYSPPISLPRQKSPAFKTDQFLLKETFGTKLLDFYQIVLQ
jgi:hypothetical protein